MKYILSVDGGGIRGIIPAILLSHIEKHFNKPTAKIFDLIAGTSTGGILALALNVKDKNGNPKYSATDLIRLYEEKGRLIFNKRFWKRGIIDEIYSFNNIDRVLNEYLGNNQFGNCLTKTVITAYELESRQNYEFKSWQNEHKNYLMKDLARCTSAAPTFFEAKKLNNKSYIDGGVFANNPSFIAYDNAKSLFPNEQLTIISIGTGKATRPISYEKAKSWGFLEWTKPIIDILFDSSMQEAQNRLANFVKRNNDNYYRFQTDLTLASDDMDKADKENIELLKMEANKLVIQFMSSGLISL